jgi:hypothetical protein
MSDVTLWLATSLDEDIVAMLSATHTTAFVSEVGDGTLRVRYSGPRGSGVATLASDASLASVLGILHEASGLAYGDLDGTQQMRLCVPAPGIHADSPEACHAARAYSVWMYTLPQAWRLPEEG